MATYTVAFLFGAVLFGDRRFEAAIRREIRWLLLVGVVAALGVGWLVFVAPSHLPEDARVRAFARAAFALLWGLNIWCWLLTVLYLGIRAPAIGFGFPAVQERRVIRSRGVDRR